MITLIGVWLIWHLALSAWVWALLIHARRRKRQQPRRVVLLGAVLAGTAWSASGHLALLLSGFQPAQNLDATVITVLAAAPVFGTIMTVSMAFVVMPAALTLWPALKAEFRRLTAD